jgi:hypothetical protein
MTELEVLGLASAWIAYWKAPEGSQERERLAWSSEREGDVTPAAGRRGRRANGQRPADESGGTGGGAAPAGAPAKPAPSSPGGGT